MSVYVTVIPDDYQKTVGLCGTFNRDESDDFDGLSEENFKTKHKYIYLYASYTQY